MIAAAFVASPVAVSADMHVPEDCAVPPFIDLTQFNVIVATDDSDVLRGTEGADFICGRLGDDVIFGLGGDDIILGDTTTFLGNVGAAGGGDVIHAGSGDDEVLPGLAMIGSTEMRGTTSSHSRSATTSGTAAAGTTRSSAGSVAT